MSVHTLLSWNGAGKRRARATQGQLRARRAHLVRLLTILLLTQVMLMIPVFIPPPEPEPEAKPNPMRIKAQLARGAP